MDAVVNLQSTPVGTALAPAVIIGGISLFLIKKFVVDHKVKSPSNLPCLPGMFVNLLIRRIVDFWEESENKSVLISI